MRKQFIKIFGKSTAFGGEKQKFDGKIEKIE